MARTVTKSLERIEERIGGLEAGTIRRRILESAKSFKTSWIELGQSLYAAWKDKHYRDWGYLTFDAYTSKEVGIRKATALKLLKSYYFLEKEEPSYLARDYSQPEDAARIPTLESVNVLRSAKNRAELDSGDYARIKREVLDMGKDASAVKKDLTSLMRQRQELEPEEARRQRRAAVLKRLVTSMKTLKSEIESQKMLPAGFLKEISNLINRLELEMG